MSINSKVVGYRPWKELYLTLHTEYSVLNKRFSELTKDFESLRGQLAIMTQERLYTASRKRTSAAECKSGIKCCLFKRDQIKRM